MSTFVSDPSVRATVAAGPHALPSVLFVSSVSQDRAALRLMLHGVPCQLNFANTLLRALKRLRRAGSAVVLCDENLPDGTWLDLLNNVSTSGAPPHLVVTSRLADDRLWAEVLHRGGFDVVAKPFRACEVQHVVKTALERAPASSSLKHFACGA